MIKKVFIVHHTHTDIGYTDIQTKIFDDYVDFIDKVLDYCKRTDNYPEDSKFRWTCEVSWTVKNYFKKRPERINEFIQRVKEGRIEVTGLYLNVTDLYTAEEFIRSLYFAMELKEKYGIKVTSAMNADINGISWVMPQLLSSAGVKYLSMATNQYRAFSPAVPRPFYWMSPDGSKVLVWNAGREGWYSDGSLLGFSESCQKVSELLPAHLEKQEKAGYSYDAICLQVAMDNQPPRLELSKIVREWNEKHPCPKIIVSTISDFFQYIEKKYREKFPSYQLAWPDWWADGNASAAYEIGLSRCTHRDIISAEQLSSVLSLTGEDYPREKINEVWNNLFFFDEHTWGAASNSIAPYSLQTKAQWAIKSSFVYQAAIETESLLKNRLAVCASKVMNPGMERIILFNLLPIERSGLVTLQLSGDKAKKIFQIKDREGYLPVQTEANIRVGKVADDQKEQAGISGNKNIFFVVKDIPSLGYKMLELSSSSSMTFKRAFSFTANSIENRSYKIVFDRITGSISNIYDKELKRELVDQNSSYKFNQYIYEEIISKKGKNALFDYAGTGCFAEKRRDARFRRTSPEHCKINKGKDGSVIGSMVIETKAKGCIKIIQEIILYDNLKRIDIVNTLLKEETLNPEAIYYSFPFNFRKPEIKFEIAGASMSPEADQLPCTAKDWYSIQDWLSISDNDCGVIWTTKEAPLVQFGEINTGEWIIDKLKVDNGTIFSWIMNNYHPTNFRASQGGEVTFRYSITSIKGKVDNAKASLFAQQCNNPLIALPIEQNLKGVLPEKECSFLSLDKKNVSLLALKQAEDKKGLIFRLMEIEGKDTTVKITMPFLEIKKVYQTDLAEKNQKAIPAEKHIINVPIKSFGINTIRIQCE